MYLLSSEHGRWWEDDSAPSAMTQHYLMFRESYTRPLATLRASTGKEKLVFFFRGLASNALSNNKLRWPIVPKLHQTEHVNDLMQRCNARFCTLPVRHELASVWPRRDVFGRGSDGKAQIGVSGLSPKDVQSRSPEALHHLFDFQMAGDGDPAGLRKTHGAFVSLYEIGPTIVLQYISM